MQAGEIRRCRPRPPLRESGAPACEELFVRRLNRRVRVRVVDRERAMGATS